jgi:hypothetical protein
MVYAGKLNGCRVRVTLLHDRYQHPFKGGYKDILLLLQVDGFVCELQLNTLHHIYLNRIIPTEILFSKFILF